MACLRLFATLVNRSIQTQKDYKMKISYDKGSERLHISQYAGYNLRLKERISTASLDFSKNMSGKFDFHDEQNMEVSGNVSNALLLFNNKANFISLSVVGLQGNFDFSCVRILYLDHSEISNANIKFNPNARFINLYKTKGLRGYLDFSNVQELILGQYGEEPDLDQVSGIKFNPTGLIVGISEAKRQLLESAYKQYEQSRNR